MGKYKLNIHLKKIIIGLLVITTIFSIITMFLLKDLWFLQCMSLLGIPFFVFGICGYWHSLGRYIDWDRKHGRYAFRETNALRIEEQSHTFVMNTNVFLFGIGIFFLLLPPLIITISISFGIYIVITNYLLMILLVTFFIMFFRKEKR